MPESTNIVPRLFLAGVFILNLMFASYVFG
jgi:hypothetical protein